MRSTLLWAILLLLAVQLTHAEDDTAAKAMAEAYKLSRQRDGKVSHQGDTLFAAVRERKGLTPAELAESWILQGKAATERRDYSLAVIALKKGLAMLPESATPDQRAEAHCLLASVYNSQSLYSRMEAEAIAALKIHPGYTDAVEMQVRALELQKREPEAVVIITEHLKGNPDITPGKFASLSGQQLRLLTTLEKWETVITSADELIAFSQPHMGLADVKLRASEARRLKVNAQLRSGDIAGGLASAKAVMDFSYTDCTVLTAVIIESESTEAIAGFVQILADVQLSDWRSQAIYDHTQPQIVRLHLALGEADKALWEAHCFYLTGSTPMLSSGALHVASSLKAVDGNLVRANQFLRFVRFGTAGEDGKTGTGDDLTDPTAGLKPVVSPERKTAIQAIIAEADGDWRVLIDVARLHVAIGQHDQALASYRAAFAKSPGTQRDTQLAADAIAGFVGRLSRDEALVKDVMSFLMYGPNGPDGKPKTGDDITDPAARVAALLKPTN